MDKMIQNSKGEVLITNDGATILKNLSVLHPIAKIVSIHFSVSISEKFIRIKIDIFGGNKLNRD